MCCFRISDKNLWNKINEKYQSNGGVYKLFCKQNDNPKPINRLLGTDNDGILYIGKGISFLDRVINLKKSISPDLNSKSHDCGVRYKSSEKIASAFPYDDLYIKLIGSSDIENLEKKELQLYIEKYGELPPLNRYG